jgi:tRNA(fMet)-specific endonuclease VapC
MNYLLDSNVLSEVVKKQPNQNVLTQLATKVGQYCTSVTVWHELQYGVERLDESSRKQSLKAYLESLERGGLPVLPYEKSAGKWLARERARLAKRGVLTQYADGEIAAVAAINQLVLVTRNVVDFEHFDGLLLENWFIQT